MPFHKDTVSFTEAHALLWLTALWGGSRDVWSEPTALWSGALRAVSCGWGFVVACSHAVDFCHR